jgi:hypothetical protein
MKSKRVYGYIYKSEQSRVEYNLSVYPWFSMLLQVHKYQFAFGIQLTFKSE